MDCVFIPISASSWLAYRNVSGVSMLTLYAATLLYSLIIFNSSGEFFTVSMCRIVSSTNSDNFTSSFPIWIPFISFPCLTALAQTSRTVVRRSRKTGQPCLVPVLRGTALSLTADYDLGCGFVTYGLYYVEVEQAC